jgi:hypothetical protein
VRPRAAWLRSAGPSATVFASGDNADRNTAAPSADNRPRFWEGDRVARSRRPRVVAGVASAAVIALSTFCVLAVVPWLPVAYYRDRDGRWIPAALLVVAAVTVHTTTCGTTAWAHRRFHKE